MTQPCANCGHANPPENKFCRKCGTSLTSAPRPAGRSSIPPSPPASPSLPSSLAALGLRVSRQQVIGLIVSVVAGLIMARILPYVYAPVVGPVLAILFGGNQSGASDSFNSFMMTTITFLTSFVVALLMNLPSRRSGGTRR